MKNLLIILLFMAPALSQAFQIVEMNESDKKIYYQFTPLLEITLFDLGADGGELMISLDYDSRQVSDEFQQLQAQYPEYKLDRVYVAPEGNLEFTFPQIVNLSIPSRMGQLGPYINTSTELTSEQMIQLRQHGPTLASEFQGQIFVRVSYSTGPSIVKKQTVLLKPIIKFQNLSL